MVTYKGYCRPLKQKVDFAVESVECLQTKKGEKWVVKGSYEGNKITTFTSKATAETLLAEMGQVTHVQEAEMEVFAAEIVVQEAEVQEAFAAEIAVVEAAESFEAPAQKHEGLTAKHYRKDGTLDMRYKICREIARGMEAESLEDYTPEELATSNVNVGDITVDAGKGGYGAEESELKKDSCCCGADKENPCACMFTGADCSAKEPMCQCYKDLAEVKDAENDTSFDAETYNKVYRSEPNPIIFNENIPPEIWNALSAESQDQYLATRDETLLAAPCCGVTKAELRMDTEANAGCSSCVFSGNDFHPRWWAEKAAPTVRTSMAAEDMMADPTNGNTMTVPANVYYKLMLQLPSSVTATPTDDGLSMILGFHNQDIALVDSLVDAYGGPQDDGRDDDAPDTFYAEEIPFIVPSVHSSQSILGAEDFSLEDGKNRTLESFYAGVLDMSDDQLDMMSAEYNPKELEMGEQVEMEHTDSKTKAREIAKEHLDEHPDYYTKLKEAGLAEELDAESLQSWGEQEMKSHGSSVSFKEWLDEEVEKHGDVDFMDWAEHEEESHEKRYGAETFGAEEKYCPCGNDFEYFGNVSCDDCLEEYCLHCFNERYDKETGEFICSKCRAEALESESFEGESKPESYMVGSDVHELSKASDKLEKLTDASKKYPEWWKSRLSVTADEADGLADYLEYAEDSGAIDRLQAEPARKVNGTLVGLLGIGALGAIFAPDQIKALFKKMR